MDEKELFNFLLSESEKPFSGWDFSYIYDTGRVDSEPLLWSYTSEILPKIRRVNSLLDMGTGGGEYLSMLQPLPLNTSLCACLRLARFFFLVFGCTPSTFPIYTSEADCFKH
jgi:hypothetical protein